MIGSSVNVIPPASPGTAPDISAGATASAGQTPTLPPSVATAPPASVSAQALLLQLIGEIAENAAAKPGGTAPLLANLQAATQAQLPDAVKPVIAQILNLALPVDTVPNAEAMRTAFVRSGLFAENTFLNTSQSAPANLALDMKSLLLVLRQGLQNWQSAEQPATAATAQAPQPQTSQPTLQTYTPQGAMRQPVTATPLPQAPTGQAAPAASPPPSATPTATPTTAQQQAPVQTASQPVQEIPNAAPPARSATSADTTAATASSTRTSAAPTVDTPVATAALRQTAMAPQTTLAPELPPSAAPLQPESASPATTPSAAPLPFAGGPTFAQSPATATVHAGDDIATVVRWLLSGCETALAHQKILQAASLPDAGETGKSNPANSTANTNWMFEIPFATPQGPAMAQFAISRDGGDGKRDARKPVWHMRFSICVEPLGPVHAQVALKGERAWVNLWADRPATLARLRADAGTLSAAMAESAFEAEIAFQPNAPQKPAPGKLVDRAL